MKSTRNDLWGRRIVLAVGAALFLLPVSALTWGFWAHKEITRQAIAIMPEPVHQYFAQIADSLIAHSIDPDLWRRFDKKEENRHYIDIDMFGPYPFAELPQDYEAAVAKFGAEKVAAAGILPWRIVEMIDSLAFAMRAQDDRLILHCASGLAHYVEDAHMPLHAVTNYDGKSTGNDGIHGRYERWMLEANQPAALALIAPSQPQPLQEVLPTVFSWILDSYVWADNLLLADSRSRTPGKTYANYKDYDHDYYQKLFERTHAMTADRLSHAANAVACCWLTAWERAGKPDLHRDNEAK